MERIKKAMDKARASAMVAARSSEIGVVPGSLPPDRTRISRSDVKVVTLDPISLERHRIIAGNKDDPRTASFDMLRTHVLQKMRESGFRTLAVTSPMPDCGKTTIAINLALSAAQLTEMAVLLGDLDLRRPKIGDYLGLDMDHGLSAYLEGSVPLEGALVDPRIGHLLILPNGKAFPNAAEILTSAEIKSLVEDLKSDDKDRVTIFDLPPMLPTDDAIAFLPQVDCVLLVVEDGATKKPELGEALRLLKGTTLLGVVLNKSDANARPAYY